MDTRTDFEHVERRQAPDRATWDVIEFTPADDGIEVIEHDAPPPELVRLMEERNER